MAADVQIRQWTGASGSETKTDVTGANSRYHSADVYSASSTDNSVLIPDSGTNYSFWRTVRLYINTISDGTVDNIRYYTDGSNDYGTGVSVVVATAGSYVQATGTVGETGDELNETNHGGLNGAPSDAFAYTSGSPLSVTGSSSTTGDVGDFIVDQLQVADTAASGTTSQETTTIKYDDTSS